jgi:hypothetical protein
LLRMVYHEDNLGLEEDLQKMGKPKWTERDGPEKTVLRELTKLAFSGLIKAYDTASRDADFRHRNWFRDRSYLDGINSELRFIRDIKTAGTQGLPLLIPRQ